MARNEKTDNMDTRTPQKKKRRSTQGVATPTGDQFERTTASPGTCSPSQGNLTGTARKVKDAAADWHNFISKWNACVSTGSDIVSSIANVKLETGAKKLENVDVVSVRAEASPQLQPLCDQLLLAFENMQSVVKKMEALTTALKGVCELEKHKKGDSHLEPIFLTWTPNEFYETSRDLHEMYAKELKLKQAVLENVAHASDRDVLMFYTASWTHEPYIERTSAKLLETMLVESGHR